MLLLPYLISGNKKEDLQIEGKFKDILRTFEAQFAYNLRTPRLRLILLVLIKKKSVEEEAVEEVEEVEKEAEN